MRIIFLTLLCIVTMTVQGLALDTYSDDAAAPAATEQGDTQPQATEPEAPDTTPDTAATEETDAAKKADEAAAQKDAAEEAASQDQIDPDQAPADPAVTDREALDDAEGLQDSGDKSVITDALRLEPIGTLTMRDGTAYEISELQKIGKYLIYISGKLNGRSSTVISLTRLSDLQHWTSIVFKDPYTFSIMNRNKKELFFSSSRLYLGSDSPTTFTFTSVNPTNYQPETVVVNKKDVKSITIK
jgi:hypothetical protein